MDAAFHDLADALRERLAIIKDEESRRDPENHMKRLQVVSSKIEVAQARLPQPVNPQLTHYLQRQSYDKALALLEGSA